MILAGGLGTRLREETERVPKPLVQIGERPIIWHIMKLYGHYGFRRFILCLGYKSHILKEYFLRYREQLSDITVRIERRRTTCTFHNTPADEDWEVTLAETGLLTGTGGACAGSATTSTRTRSCSPTATASARSTSQALLDFHRAHDRSAP